MICAIQNAAGIQRLSELLYIQCWGEKQVWLRRKIEVLEEWREEKREEEKEWEKRLCYVKRGDFSHVIADSAPQPGCTRIYYFSRAWKTQQIKLWSGCLLEMDIFILDFGFSCLKSTFETVSHQTVAWVWAYINLWGNFFLSIWETSFMILSVLLSTQILYIKCENKP